MGKQVNFFLDSVDHTEILQFVEQKGFRAVPQIIESDMVPETQLPTQYENPTYPDEGFFYLLPDQFAVAEAFYNELGRDPNFSKLMSRSSPVIEFSPAKAEADQIVEGRIYFNDLPSDPRYDAALKAYQSIARYLKKWPKTSVRGFVIGPHAAEVCQSGHAKVIYGGKTVEIL